MRRMPILKTTPSRLALASVTAAAVLLGACGSGEDSKPSAPRPESAAQQIRAVGKQAAAAVAAQDAAKLCAVTDTKTLEERVRDSDYDELKELMRARGSVAVCELLARQLIFDQQNAEERADAESFEIVSVKVEGDEATAEVRTHNDRTDATFKRVDGEWKFISSTALE